MNRAREPGYYWVRYHCPPGAPGDWAASPPGWPSWAPAQWDGKAWWILGASIELVWDGCFEQVGERMLPPAD